MLQENRCSSCGAPLPPNKLVCDFCGATFNYIRGSKIVTPSAYFPDRLNEAKSILTESIQSSPISQNLFLQSLTLFSSLLPENYIVINNAFFDVWDDYNINVSSIDVLFITETLKPIDESNKLLSKFYSEIIVNFYYTFKRQFFSNVQTDYDYHKDKRFENITESWFIKRRNTAIKNFEDKEKEFNDFIDENSLRDRIDIAISILKNQEYNE